MPEMTVTELLHSALKICDEAKFKFEYVGMRKTILLKNYQDCFANACTNSASRLASRVDAYIRNKDDGLQEQLAGDYWKSVNRSCDILEDVYLDVNATAKRFKIRFLEYQTAIQALKKIKTEFERGGNKLNVELEAQCQYHLDLLDVQTVLADASVKAEIDEIDEDDIEELLDDDDQV